MKSAGSIEDSVNLPASAAARARAARFGGRAVDAVRICEEALRTFPDHKEVLLQLCLALGAIPDRIPDAIGRLEAACQQAPEEAVWQTLLGSMYRLENRLDDALTHTRRASGIAPRDYFCRLNLGLVYRDLGDEEQALACFMGVLAERPDYHDAHLGIAEILLARGEFAAGWIEYEERLPPIREVRGGETRWPEMVAPKWNGMRLPRGRILIIADQGYGDVIQFARYIPMVAERCHQVALVCDPALAPLLRVFPGVATFSADWRAVPAHTAWCRLSSLPGIFGTDLTTIPQAGTYIEAPPDRVDAWRLRLADWRESGLGTVGLVWAGRPTHGNDRRRSIHLEQLRPLLSCPGLQWISLQKPIPARDATVIGEFPGLLALTDELVSYGETAALVANLDLVVTVDSSVAHLAGAMGKPVWVLLPEPADWRWLKATETSPWYPGMRLYRQPRPGDWSTAIARLAADLRSWPHA